MHRIILPLLIFGSFIVTYADSAVQTDWSKGPEVFGPVIDWGNQFFFYTDVDWSSIPGAIALNQLIIEHIVDGDFDSAHCVYSEDIDGDGFMDILGGSWNNPGISWWENVDGTGTSWTEHIVDEDFNSARSVYSEDIDGDGNMDVLGASWDDDDITWWENSDTNPGIYWTRHTIDGDFDGAHCVYSEDIDGDGDMDILGAAFYDSDIIWWENVDGSGTSWTAHIVNGDCMGANSCYSEDIDSDGDKDVLGAAYADDEIIWWENVDGTGTSWTEHIVDGNFNGAFSVYSEDINDDGYMDILGAAYHDNIVNVWLNSDTSPGIYWFEYNVDGYYEDAHCVYSEDIDGDGNMDILGAALGADDITWWKNVDGSGTSWTEHTVDGNFNSASSVYSEDIDGDGDMDILGAAIVGEITWWEQLSGYSPGGTLESSVLDTQGDPYWDYIEWNSQTSPETSSSFQVRASDNYNIMGNWSDTLSSPCSLAGILNDGDRYLQYRAILETSNPDSTPTLNDVTISWNPLGIGETAERLPIETELLPFASNPTAGLPIIRFGLPETASVELSIFDLSGRLVSEIHGDEYSQGFHEVQIGDLYPGIYFCRMISGDFAATQSFVVIQ